MFAQLFSVLAEQNLTARPRGGKICLGMELLCRAVVACGMPQRFDQAYWLKRAEEARIAAAQFQDGESKRIMLAIAEGYDRMRRAAERPATTRTTLVCGPTLSR